MKAVVFDRFGEPDDVLRIRDVPIPEPKRGEVRVRMIASPINPSDLLVVRGRYGVLPKLPSTPGFEGVGVVDKVGGGLLGWMVKGKRVAVINSAGGNWAEYAVIPAKQARPFPQDIPDEQVAAGFVNPATVLALVRHVLKVPAGDWLLQSAANSSLGRMVIRLAKKDGIKTISVVRRRDAIAELKELGSDVVLSTEDGPIHEQVRGVTGGLGVRHAIDPVGGAIGTELFRSLGDDGRLIVYGSLSELPLQIEPRLMIAGKRSVPGFWLGHWMRSRSIPASLRLFREIAAELRSGVLASEVGGSYSIDEVVRASAASESSKRVGKVFLKL